MRKEIVKFFLDLLYKAETQNAEAKQIARHMSQILLYPDNFRTRIDQLYPDVRDKCELLQKRMIGKGKPIWIVETFRTADKQDDYYTREPRITNAKGLESYHQYCLAFDVAFKTHNWSPPSATWWDVLGEEAKKIGLEWGGSWQFEDRGHLQYDNGGRIKWQDLQPYFELVQ